MTGNDVEVWPFRAASATLICRNNKPYLVTVGELRIPFDKEGDAEGNMNKWTYSELNAKFFRTISSPLPQYNGLGVSVEPFMKAAQEKCK